MSLQNKPSIQGPSGTGYLTYIREVLMSAARKSWTLIDVADEAYIDHLALGPDDCPGSPAGWSIGKRRLRGGQSDGVDLVELDNGRMSVAVVPTRGMGIWRATSGGRMLGWQSPTRGPVHPAFVPLMEPGGLGWLDGFNELLVRCGLESVGPPNFGHHGHLVSPLHGRIANIPAHRVEVAFDVVTGEISVTGVVDECRFHFHKLRLTSTVTLRLGESGFRVRDTVTNLSGAPATMQLLYHINFGPPMLGAKARLVAPVTMVVPRDKTAAGGIDEWPNYVAPQPAFEEEVFFFDLASDDAGQTQVLLHNDEATEGVSLRFNKQQLPCFAQWKNTVPLEDGYVTGLEPGTCYPNPRKHEAQHGRLVKLAPGGSREFEVELTWHQDAAAVARAEKDVVGLQEGIEPIVHRAPQPEWCAK